MKKAIIILTLAMLLMTFGGCKEKNGTGVVTPAQTTQPADTTTSDSSDTADTTAGTTTTPPGDKTKLDLAVMDVYFSPIYPKTGEDVKLRFIVKNQGLADIDGFDYSIKILKDGTVWKQERSSSDGVLKRGEEAKITAMYMFTSTGTYSAEVTVDPDNKIEELIETNNNMKAKADATVLQ